MAKSGGANLLERSYFYCKKLKSYGTPLKSDGAAAHCPTLSAAYESLAALRMLQPQTLGFLNHLVTYLGLVSSNSCYEMLP